jgi:hypothetical protein
MTAPRYSTSPRQPLVGVRRGAVPLWLTLGLALVAFAWATSQLRSDSRAAGFTRIDPARIDFSTPGSDAVPVEWKEHLAASLSQLGELSTLDENVVERIVARIERMSFVSAVGEARVAWPDGITVDVKLREAVACIRIGPDFLTVAADGMVLPGYRIAPCDLGLGMLPVIGPNDGSFDDFGPGDVLVEDRHFDALSVAVSMREFLSPGDLDLLGPVVIDASKASLASVTEPGTRLYLEDRRLVWFGRAPRAVAPGELPQKEKWRHLMRAIGSLSGDDPPDWDLVDVRWDVRDQRPR